MLGEIPLKTWRWLGVNQLQTSAQVDEQIISVPDGEIKKLSAVNLSNDNIARKIKISVGKGARVEFISADLGRGDYSADVEIDLLGDDSVADLEAVYFGDAERKLDFNYVIRQHGKRTSANMNVRGALTDKSDKIFRGTLDFKRGAKNSTGRELEEVI
ncbi:MAG: SufD family Fe-S cluster assembly protein, partial [Selenomonadaceae bacterium]|nr:SufD family Fe-S cluster assembly protein [Selenomonadaceae bacterium]